MGVWDNVPSWPPGHVPTGPETAVVTTLLTGLLDESAAVKGSPQSVTSSTTLVNDNDLVLPVVANAIYTVDCVLLYTAGATGLLKLGWAGPTLATLSWAPDGLASSVTASFTGVINRAQYTIGSFPIIGAAGVAQPVAARLSGLMRTSATAGSLQFKFAQTVSDANATTILADSFMLLKRIG